MMMMTTKLRQALKRRRWRPADAEVVLAAYAASEQTLEAFAREHGLHLSRLRRWPARLRRIGRVEAAPEESDDAVCLLPVRLRGQAEPTPAALVTLDVSVGAAIVHVHRAFDAEHLRRVVQALAMPC